MNANAVRSGVASLAARFGLCSEAEASLLAILDLVAEDPAAPTTLRRPEAILTDHLADSLVALELEQVQAARAIVDIGAGAGFPGLPLAVALPRADVALVEASSRKCEFIKRVIESCGVANARAIWARAETWPEGHGGFDLVTARALAPLGVVAEYAAPLLRSGGVVVAWRGRRDRGDEEIAARAAAELGLEPLDPIAVRPYPEATNRHLHLMLKVMETPPRFPRRPGIARKRPLGVA
jgi:16S rRNA (guanine527-N7)-methyltransferase